nr:hypothetical protein [Lysinibacillus timonensis]
MGFFMKALSIITGSSEETLHNARAEMSNHYGKGLLSNESEKQYVFEQIINYLPQYFSPQEIRQSPTGYIIGFIIDDLAQHKKNEKFIQVFNRVMVYYYNYEMNKIETLEPALLQMGYEFESYVQRYIR